LRSIQTDRFRDAKASWIGCPAWKAKPARSLIKIESLGEVSDSVPQSAAAIDITSALLGKTLARLSGAKESRESRESRGALPELQRLKVLARR
jgi:hypothetical protein